MVVPTEHRPLSPGVKTETSSLRGPGRLGEPMVGVNNVFVQVRNAGYFMLFLLENIMQFKGIPNEALKNDV